jgi:hypothetical protein
MLYRHDTPAVRLADNLHATPPNGHEGLTDAEMEKVARRDLGCSRRSTYRDLGRGPRQGFTLDGDADNR